jgi:hypothetical protein
MLDIISGYLWFDIIHKLQNFGSDLSLRTGGIIPKANGSGELSSLPRCPRETTHISLRINCESLAARLQAAHSSDKLLSLLMSYIDRCHPSVTTGWLVATSLVAAVFLFSRVCWRESKPLRTEFELNGSSQSSPRRETRNLFKQPDWRTLCTSFCWVTFAGCRVALCYSSNKLSGSFSELYQSQCWDDYNPFFSALRCMGSPTKEYSWWFSTASKQTKNDKHQPSGS